MNYKITNGSVSYGADTILEEINFEIRQKEKIAIVGRNGCGKSTLLTAIVDNDMLEQGVGDSKFSVSKQGNPVIGVLNQFSLQDENITMLDEILKVYKDVIETENKLSKLVEQMQDNSSEELAQEYTKTMERYEFLDGYTYKKEYETVIAKFGFKDEDKNKKISEFSGGQRTKIAFIKLLLSKPDILLLDEPTNHLDVTTIEWLERYLKNYTQSVVIVSHDRMFLNKIVDRIYEIEYGAMTEYSGNYTFYEEQKKINYEKQLKDYEYQQKEIKRLTDIANRFRYKPTKAKMAMSKLKQVERMVKIEEPNKYDLDTFRTNFEINRESGRNVLSVRELEIGYNTVLEKVSFDLYRGKRLAVIGSNGTGKSTFLKTIIKNIKALGGEFELGHNVDIGYFEQQMSSLDPNKTVIEDFNEKFPQLTVTQVRNSLAAFMFYGEDVFKQTSMLSGGEKVRLELSEILKKGPNLLILDEPTNHMDIVGKESLENLLKAYKGTIIFVSHDRYFVDKIADSLLIFEPHKATYYEGTYSEYLESQENEINSLDDGKSENKTCEKVLTKSNQDYLKNKEKNKIIKQISKAEEEINNKEEEIQKLEEEQKSDEVSSNYVRLKEIQDEIDNKNNELMKLMNNWENLQEKLNEF